MSVPSVHGALVSFGSSNLPAVSGDRLAFSGSGSLSGDPDNTAATQTTEPVDTVDQILGQPYAVSLSGPSTRPQKDTTLTYQYWLAVPDGTADADVQPAMQAIIDALWAWYFGSYAYTGDAGNAYAGASGMAGDLVAQDAAGTAQVCPADWDSWTAEFVAGEPAQYQQTLTFTQLGDWVAQV